MSSPDSFFDLHRHGFLRVALAVPQVNLAQPAENARTILRLMAQAAAQGAQVVVFPELCLSGYSCDDLFHQDVLLEACQDALREVCQGSQQISVAALVGLPWRHQGHLFNCAALVAGGEVCGLIPKSYLPNYREFYEARQFTPALSPDTIWLDWPSQEAPIPFGPHQLFRLSNLPLAVLSVEICEDLWVPIPPSSLAALAGATVLLNASASNASVGKADYRRQLVANQSARCLAAYVYSAAGVGESTTDLAWDGHGMIADYGRIIAESTRYAREDQLVFADIDVLRLQQERLRQNTFAHACQRHQEALRPFTTVTLALPTALSCSLLYPTLTRFPYVPEARDQLEERCAEVFHIQVQGLTTRLQATGLKTLILGVSGGLDSTHALLACCAVLDQLGLPRTALRAYTMPGFATGSASLALAWDLMRVLGVQGAEIDIRPSCQQMLQDIGHPYATGQPVYDITFENVQAGERSSHLFRLANQHRGLVVGTSDLSELALGWSTYGVGDHMAHYHVNASVPKTLIRHLLRWAKTTGLLTPALTPVLAQVLEQDISPELIPAQGGQIQRSEDTVGPYPLQDFFLYHTLRFGFGPQRLAYMAWCTWGRGDDHYDFAIIRHWLGIFVERFFQGSQFKRSCLANGPKVGSGGSLSPRGDWRAPSDISAALWRHEMQKIPSQGPHAPQ